MIMIVQLGNTSKRKNSTLQPTLTKSVNCILKDGCSILDPVLIFERANITHTYNYVYIADFGRYYFVTDIQYINAQIVYYCQVDPLASFKTEIGASSHYVLRSASDSDGSITDNIYPVKSTQTYIEQQLQTFSGHSYVLGVASNGGINYYVCDGTSIPSLISYLFSDTYATACLGIYSIANTQMKMLLDPLQYIVCFKHFPISVTNLINGLPNSTISTVATMSIPVGLATATATGGNGFYQLIGPYFDLDCTVTQNITLQHHPDILTRGRYLDLYPYSECYLVTPGGSFQLDLNTLGNAYDVSGSISVTMKIDLASGYTVLRVYNNPLADNPGEVTDICQASFNLSVDMPVVQLVSKGVNNVSILADTVGKTLSGFLAGGDIGAGLGLIGGVADGIGDAIEGKIPKVNMVSGNGGFNYAYRGIRIQYIFHDIVDTDVAEFGSPLCKVKTLNTLSGFILCKGAHAEITGTDNERDQIEEYLNSGFFYE